MTRAEAQAIVNALVTLRGAATDEQALTAPALYPAWRSGTTYQTGERVRFDGTLYKVLQNHTAQEDWTPEAAVSLFAKVLIPDGNTAPEWQQPDSTNAYAKGDRVMHNGQMWISTIDNNVWAPGVYGWEVVE